MAEHNVDLSAPGQFPEYGQAMAEMNLLITDEPKPQRKPRTKGGTGTKAGSTPTVPSPEMKPSAGAAGKATHIKMTPALNEKFSRAHFLYCYRMQKMVPKTEFLSIVLDEWLEGNGG